MLSPDDPLDRVVALALALALAALLVVRAVQKDRREYARFRRYRSTARRQAMLRKWLVESLVLFGGSAAVLLAIVPAQLAPVLEQTQGVPWVAAVRGFLTSAPGLAGLVVAAVGTVLLTAVGLRSARREGGVVMVGDIAALLPRNRPELAWGAGLSLTAGVVEELLFRLALPALLFVVTGEPVSAFALALVVFATLHAYQGVAGVAGTALVGLLLTAVYVLSGSIVATIIAHAVIDLRTLVLVPVAVYGVHRVPGSLRMPPPLAAVRLRESGHPDRS